MEESPFPIIRQRKLVGSESAFLIVRLRKLVGRVSIPNSLVEKTGVAVPFFMLVCHVSPIHPAPPLPAVMYFANFFAFSQGKFPS